MSWYGLAGAGLFTLGLGVLMTFAAGMSSLPSDRAPFGVWLILGGTAAMVVGAIGALVSAAL